MTTAHRPTWKPAYGLTDSVNKGYAPTRSYSVRDLPSYLKLKERQMGQGSFAQLKEKDFKSQLLKRQAEVLRKKKGQLEMIEGGQIQQENLSESQRFKRKAEQGVDFIDRQQATIRKKIKRPGQQQQQQQAEQQFDNDNPFPEDADSESFVKESEQEERPRKRVESDEEQSDEEDSEELLREYEKIKEQRQRQQLQKRQQKHRQSIANRETELMKGNPLVDSSYSLSKRWYEDTVFRNQAKKVQQKKSYINDFVRSDFHRKFMHRFVGR